MAGKIFHYPVLVQEVYLDFLGHMNNVSYLTLFEEARWDFLTKTGYGFKKIQDSKASPIILEATTKFIKEILCREEIVIQSQTISYERKVGKLKQTMYRGSEMCCEAIFTIGLFDMIQRKLLLPTPEWIKAIGL